MRSEAAGYSGSCQLLACRARCSNAMEAPARTFVDGVSEVARRAGPRPRALEAAVSHLHTSHRRRSSSLLYKSSGYGRLLGTPKIGTELAGDCRTAAAESAAKGPPVPATALFRENLLPRPRDGDLACEPRRGSAVAGPKEGRVAVPRPRIPVRGGAGPLVDDPGGPPVAPGAETTVPPRASSLGREGRRHGAGGIETGRA
jgi:hypothetical protein